MTPGGDLVHINNLGIGRRREITHIHVLVAGNDVSILFRDQENAAVAYWTVRAEASRSKWGLLDDAQTLYQFVIGPGARELDDDGIEHETYQVRWMPRRH